MKRLAVYMVECLAARITSSGKGLYKALNCKKPPSNHNLSGIQILFEIYPYFKFEFLAAQYVDQVQNIMRLLLLEHQLLEEHLDAIWAATEKPDQ